MPENWQRLPLTLQHVTHLERYQIQIMYLYTKTNTMNIILRYPVLTFSLSNILLLIMLHMPDCFTRLGHKFSALILDT